MLNTMTGQFRDAGLCFSLSGLSWLPPPWLSAFGRGKHRPSRSDGGDRLGSKSGLTQVALPGASDLYGPKGMGLMTRRCVYSSEFSGREV